MADSPTERVYRNIVDVLTADVSLTTAGYSQSPWTYDQLPTGTREKGHLVWAVGIITTEAQPSPDRQKAGPGCVAYTATMVGVRTLFRLRPDNTDLDYASALAGTDLMINVTRGASKPATATYGPQTVRWVSTSHLPAADGLHHLSTSLFEVWHTTPISTD